MLFHQYEEESKLNDQVEQINDEMLTDINAEANFNIVISPSTRPRIRLRRQNNNLVNTIQPRMRIFDVEDIENFMESQESIQLNPNRASMRRNVNYEVIEIDDREEDHKNPLKKIY